MVLVHTAAKIINIQLRLLLVTALLVCFSWAGPQTALYAAPYGIGTYDSSCYSSDCLPAAAAPATPANPVTNPQPTAHAATVGAPNTGLERTSLTWALVVGFIGFSLISIVIIRLLNTRVSKK